MGSETLGVYLAPNDSQDEELKYMHDKVDDWCEKIKTGHITARKD